MKYWSIVLSIIFPDNSRTLDGFSDCWIWFLTLVAYLSLFWTRLLYCYALIIKLFQWLRILAWRNPSFWLTSRGFRYFDDAFGSILTLPVIVSIHLPAYNPTPSGLIGPKPVALKLVLAYIISLMIGGICYVTCVGVSFWLTKYCDSPNFFPNRSGFLTFDLRRLAAEPYH